MCVKWFINRCEDTILGNENFSAPTLISLRANFIYCPLSLGLADDCAINAPRLAVTSAAVDMVMQVW
ncbi:hypothetical protein CPB84DRAFT_1768997 [Gymnopilus junonius]|uniref:Uncharacterized protein n=1 Tax=Gymnopilus junonius TaxID=109634 RepID=A0A9P5NXQ1_GYMJU|nr:hypothetical protein CPB84DRAFT_1768997 [Gymnopilus junonius]